MLINVLYFLHNSILSPFSAIIVFKLFLLPEFSLRSAGEGSILASPSLHLTSSFDCLWDSVPSHWKAILVITLSLHPRFFVEIYWVCPWIAYNGCCCCCWSLLHIAILRSGADSLCSLVILHEWLALYSAFLNIHRSGVLTALAWLVPHETAAISARSVYTIQPCTMSLHAKPHT